MEANLKYSGDPAVAYLLNSDQVDPRSMSSGDFDEDGIADLVCGYRTANGGGIVALFRANPAAIYPNNPEVTERKIAGWLMDAAFLSPVHGYSLRESADYIGSGDFDNDGHWDVVVASKQGNSLYFLRGNGHGELLSPRQLKLPGNVTALVSGEVNKMDGLADLVLGLITPGGPRLLVYDAQSGALNKEPEIIILPGPATSIALGRFNEDAWIDLAITAGDQLFLINGRDTKKTQDNIPRHLIRILSFSQPILSIVVGDYDSDQNSDIGVLLENGTVEILYGSKSASNWIPANRVQRPAGARLLLRARISENQGDDLITANLEKAEIDLETGTFSRVQAQSGSSRVLISKLDRDPVAILPMRLNIDALSDLVMLTKGHTSPEVIASAANATFSVNSTGDEADTTPGDGVCQTSLSQCTLRAAIQEANALSGADLINFSGGSITITPLSNLPSLTDTVTIDGTGNYIRTLSGPNLSPVLNISAANSVIRGLTITNSQTDNIRSLSANGGIIENNTIRNAGDSGIYVSGSNFTIQNNDISNNAIGILSGGSNSIIRGNLLHGNGCFGIQFTQNTGSVLGGTTSSARNLISGNGCGGVALNNANNGIVIQGNYIGTASNGISAQANTGPGVKFETGSPLGNSNNMTVGGTAAGAGNVIAYNTNGGVLIGASNNGNAILRNSIFDNSSLGISLGSGGNNNQAVPNLTSATTSNGTTTISGTLSSAANQTFQLEFFDNPSCDPSGFGEGKIYIGTKSITTNGSGQATFTYTPASALSNGRQVTSTVTSATNNTSPFSNCQTVTSPVTSSISVNDVTVTEGNSGTTNAVFTVMLSPSSGSTVTVDYSTANGTATLADNDYQSVSGTLTFSAGQTSKQITVQVNGDTNVENNETFFVNLSGASGASVSDNQGQGTITNDDGATGGLSINDVKVAEGNSGTTAAVFTVSLSPASSSTVTADYATANNTATTSDQDYAATSGQLTFSAGQTNKTITVVVNGDTKSESDETFFVNLTNAANATIVDGQGIGTIQNDESAPGIHVQNVSQSSGIANQKVETAAVQWLDYNGDGKLDLFLVGHNGNALFENLGNGKFKDVTKKARIGNAGRDARGASWADFNNDGFPDVFIANATGNPTLLINKKGVFKDISAAISSASASVSSAIGTRAGIWFDFNNDKLIDLFVVREGQPNQLFKQSPVLQFNDIAPSAGLDATAPGRAAVAGDFNQDGYPDIYVVNFKSPNKLYINNKDDTFHELHGVVEFSGASVQATVADYNRDQNHTLDILVVNNEGSSFILKNLGNLHFRKRMPGPIRAITKGIAAAFSDYDLDGDEDLVIAQTEGGNVLLRNAGGGKFKKVTGIDLNNPDNPTGIAVGDFNNDGLPDIAIGDSDNSQLSGDSLYRNIGGGGNNYLKVTLQGTSSNRSAIGAQVIVRTGLIPQLKIVSSGNGQDQSSLTLEFGVGTAQKADSVRVVWPSGKIQEMQDVAVNQTLLIKEEP